MSKHNRERREKNRRVQVTIVPKTPTMAAIGVGIWLGHEGGKTVIAPDEARTIACQIEQEDPNTAAQLRKCAADMEMVLAD